MISYGSTFTGIRGLDLAFEHVLAARCLYAVERSAFCREIIAQHCPGLPIVADIRELCAASAPSTDAIVGGFPCQGASDAGPRTGLQHAATGLWRESLGNACVPQQAAFALAHLCARAIRAR